VGFLLHHSVDEAAARAPDHTAFRFAGEAMTYAELAGRSARFARVLVEQGVRRHDRVGIYMNKGLELPVALYGTLRCGAAFVPIDPDVPLQRVELITRDCGIRHLVTNGSRARRAGRVAAAGHIDAVIGAPPPDEGPDDVAFVGWDAVASAPTAQQPVRLVEDDLAYVMYTSGSTGAPKGLMHTHASGLAYARLSAREYGVMPQDRLGNHSPLHFDMSTFEYLTGPFCGATTVIIPEEATMFPRSLAELIEAERLTFWYSVPLALIQLLELGDVASRDCSSLRWVLFGGEPFPPKHLARLMRLWPGARFSNSYGPAEVNQCTAHHVSRDRELDPDAPIPLGELWPGAEGVIVDDDGEDVVGEGVGELWVRAPTMMRGYWGRPDLNREAFAYRELFPNFEKRFYRTGDLVRRGADGNLVFVGRKDRQIKVRGYRVELEEIEAVLGSLPGVAEAAAVDLGNRDGGIDVVAAVRPGPGAALDGADLRKAAQGKLPSYAVPARILVLDSMPRTGSGKVDRGALRAAVAEGDRESFPDVT